jgi:hypothetical protein
MRDESSYILLAIAVSALVFVAWRWHRYIAQQQASGAVPPAPPGAPLGSGAIPLGQFAVAPGKQWLLIQPGQ